MTELISRRDLAFVLYDVLDTEALCQRPRYAEHSRETFDQIIDAADQLAVRYFAPHWKIVDENEPTFDGERVVTHPAVKEALDAYIAAGFMLAGQPTEHGGLQLPCVVEKAAFAFFKAANVGSAAYPLLATGAANLILAHGSEDQITRFARPILDGRFMGTMALSETQAGSSLADITARAVPQADGAYRLFGSKMWISAGDHELSENIIHLVLARIEGAPAGVRGISLFIVPKFLLADDGSSGEPNDVCIGGLNYKMGYRGSVNTVFNLGEGKHRPGGEAGAVGYLVGAPNQGLGCMFHMMNEARIGVGLGAVVLGYRGYLESLAYARARPQGRRFGAKDPTTPQIPIIEHADVRRMLLAQKAFVEGGLALTLYCARLVDEERTGSSEEARRHATRLLDLLTPIAKAWPSQFCLEANSLAIQVLGGYGYTREYPVEQLYRDNRLNSIHEGTDGIQALDLLGRKVRLDDGLALKLLVDRMRGAAEEAQGIANDDLLYLGDGLAAGVDALIETTSHLVSCLDQERGMANAFAYLTVFGHTVVAWLWLEQVLAAQRALDGGQAGDDEAFYRGKLQTARYFYTWVLGPTQPVHALLRRLDDTTLAMNPGWF